MELSVSPSRAQRTPPVRGRRIRPGTAMPLAAGSHLGTFEILGPLGAGGMGEVYRARDRRLEREVAIKVLPARLAGDSGGIARFEREARLLAALNHPGIATIYGAEVTAEERYIVLELVPGETLKERLQDRKSVV